MKTKHYYYFQSVGSERIDKTYVYTLYLEISVGPVGPINLKSCFNLFIFFLNFDAMGPNNSKSTGRDLHFYRMASKSDGILMVS